MDRDVPALQPIYFIYLAAWIVPFCICIASARRYCLRDGTTTRTDLDWSALHRIHNYRYNEERHQTPESRQARNELVRKYLNTKQITRVQSVVELIQDLASHPPNEEKNKNKDKADADKVAQSRNDTTSDCENSTSHPDDGLCINISHCVSDDTGDTNNTSESLSNETPIDAKDGMSKVNINTSPDQPTSLVIESVSSQHSTILPQDNTVADIQEGMSDNRTFCAICLQSFLPMDKIAWTKEDKLECFHVFHEGCLVSWLHWHDDCPLCRRVIVGADL
ncbi:hypothetical protein HJC23_001972 [Cyclotella cryptica]|uniref:RING-type domain-containing protein n=1 Tax=Cyclotella cryptica TaxID=29204 RepID=A0ABD3PNW2_9STRA|eukprot:CCRYP_012939-RA/>CCRYP_012939-RA protein AED:0.39 eAED:-0.83 QI:0/-1/0/1/-1/1/1/0/277